MVVFHACRTHQLFLSEPQFTFFFLSSRGIDNIPFWARLNLQNVKFILKSHISRRKINKGRINRLTGKTLQVTNGQLISDRVDLFCDIRFIFWSLINWCFSPLRIINIFKFCFKQQFRLVSVYTIWGLELLSKSYNITDYLVCLL